MKMDTFIAFSGGIDSTYNLWRWLKENPKKKILVHHVTYFNNEGTGLRGYHEKEAVDNILRWLNEQGLTNYEYRESVLDLKDFPRFGLDHITLSPLHALLLSAYPDINKWVKNTPRDEYERLGDQLQAWFTRADRLIRIIAKKQYDTIYSLEKMYKKDIIEAMPIELLELTWYCRSPQIDGSTCGQCHTCKQVSEHIDEKGGRKDE